MAANIANLIKTLEEKYRELSEKEADYLAASETRCGPPQELIFPRHVHFKYHHLFYI